MRNDRFVPSIYRSSEQLRAFGARAGMLLGLFTGLGLAVWVSIAGAGPLAAILAYSFGGSTIFLLIAFVGVAIEEQRMRRLGPLADATDGRPTAPVARMAATS